MIIVSLCATELYILGHSQKQDLYGGHTLSNVPAPGPSAEGGPGTLRDSPQCLDSTRTKTGLNRLGDWSVSRGCYKTKKQTMTSF